MSEKYFNICQKCGAACCKMGGPDFTENEMKRVLDADFDNYFAKAGRYYELKSKKGICPYLNKDSSCRIYHVRPSMCRCWPVFFKYEKGRKIFIIASCPLTPVLTKKQIKEMKIQATKIPKEILEGSFTNSHLSKSDLKLIRSRFDRFKMRELK